MFTPSSTSSSSSSSQELLWSLYNRRLLLHSIATAASPPATSATSNHDPSQSYTKPNNGFDANVVMVLSVLLCALICSLGLNSIVRCALRCSSLMARESSYDENNDDDNNNNQRVNSARLANTGIKKAALKTFPTISYSADLKMPGLDTECVICLSEFAPGERVRLLPKCHHGFHVRCIDKWLNSHSSCPTCRSCLIETCQKIVGCNQASSSQPPRRPHPPPPPPPPPPTQTQETVINMAPLEREAMMHTYSGSINSLTETSM